MDINNKWSSFINSKSAKLNPFLTNVRQQKYSAVNNHIPQTNNHSSMNESTTNIPLLDMDAVKNGITPLHISTKTISLFLNTPIDIYKLFEKIKINSYSHLGPGIIKKQIILEAPTKAEATQLYTRLMGLQILSPVPVSINCPRTPKNKTYKFHVSVGFSRKNFKKPSVCAFSHCIAITIRVLFDKIFHDTHIKIFNTGKVEIPGKFTQLFIDALQQRITELLWDMLQISIIKYTNEPVAFINSNFGIPILLNLEKCYQILNNKYHLNTTFDICKFHGITCSFYYNTTVRDEDQTGYIEKEDEHLSNKKLKLMGEKYLLAHFICYQTGKCLIAGKISERVLRVVYNFFCNLITNEYMHFYEGARPVELDLKSANKKRAVKVRVTNEYVLNLSR